MARSGCAAVVLVIVLVPFTASGQGVSTAAIGGVARDASDAVLPGVTVEARSPALIEGVRTVFTDGQGQYRIVELEPGTYSVTFTLPGFRRLVREGIELTSGFSAPVSAVLEVGAVEETVTVTAASPTVDVQSVRIQEVLSREKLDTLPTAKNLSSLGALIVGASNFGSTGVTQDVGGNQGEPFIVLSVHGSDPFDQRLLLDGMPFGEFAFRGAGIRMMTINQVNTAEINMSTGSNDAEANTSGVLINIVPKEGANNFSFFGLSNYTDANFQGQNLNDELQARGLDFTPEARFIYDQGFGIGGPIVQDKLWFYTGHRWWGASEDVNRFFNATQGAPLYTPDLSRRAFIENTFRDNNVRLTWQTDGKGKFNFYVGQWDTCLCFNTIGTGTRAPEAGRRVDSEGLIGQVTWTHPVTNRVLFEAGTSYAFVPALQGPTVPEIQPDHIASRELSTGFQYNALATCCGANYGGLRHSDPFATKFSLTYVTGSHTFKTGFYSEFGFYDADGTMNGDVVYQYFNQRPTSIIQWATPFREVNKFLDTGFYAQDQWTIKRLTLNLGARFEAANGWVPPYEVPAGRFVGVRPVPEQRDIPDWKEFNPRFGAAYDLFGNGKTAIKGHLGRYSVAHGQDIIRGNNVLNRQPNSATRAWTDLNEDFVPDCDLTSPLQNGECGPSSIDSFGQARTVRNWDQDALSGFGVREYNWQGSVSVSHELYPGWGVEVAWFRTSFGNLITTDNLVVGPGDYSEYCVTSPMDPQLPGDVQGREICGLFDVSPQLFGATDQLVLNSSDRAPISRVYKGVDLNFSGRFARGFLGGGFSIGNQVGDTCDLWEVLPETQPAGQSRGFCEANTVESLADSVQVKLNGAYELPWGGVNLSATFQNLPGIPIAISRTFTNHEIAPSLGRNLASCGTLDPCGRTVRVNLTKPGETFEERLTQVDLKIARPFRVRGGRVQLIPSLAIFNLFNGSYILQETTRLGPQFLVPRTILAPRIFKFELQVNM